MVGAAQVLQTFGPILCVLRGRCAFGTAGWLQVIGLFGELNVCSIHALVLYMSMSLGAAPRVLGLPNTSRGDHSSLRSTPNGAGCTGPEESSARMCSRGCRTSASVCCGGLPFVWSSTRMDLAFIHDCAKRRGCNRLIYHFYQWMQELAGRESALGGREHFHLRARTSLVLTKGSLRANPNNEEAGFWFGAQTPKCAPGTSPILYFP